MCVNVFTSHFSQMYVYTHLTQCNVLYNSAQKKKQFKEEVNTCSCCSCCVLFDTSMAGEACSGHFKALFQKKLIQKC